MSARVGLGAALVTAAMASSASALEFPGTGLGPIPDGPGTPDICDGPGTPLVVSFAVSGLTVPVRDVGVRITFNPPHTYVADVRVELSAPGISPFSIFGMGDTVSYWSNLAGPYEFADHHHGDWWAAALATPNDSAIPAGGYRTSTYNNSAQTSLNAAFGRLPAEQANAIWALTFTDDCAGETGSVSSATLLINEDSIFANGFDS